MTFLGGPKARLGKLELHARSLTAIFGPEKWMVGGTGRRVTGFLLGGVSGLFSGVSCLLNFGRVSGFPQIVWIELGFSKLRIPEIGGFFRDSIL